MAASLKAVAEFFGGPLSQFSQEWRELDETSREQIKNGIGDGTYTY